MNFVTTFLTNELPNVPVKSFWFPSFAFPLQILSYRRSTFFLVIPDSPVRVERLRVLLHRLVHVSILDSNVIRFPNQNMDSPGFEPGASPLQRERSTVELRAPEYEKNRTTKLMEK